MKPKDRPAAKRQALLWLNMGWPRHRIDEQLCNLFGATPEDTALILSEIRHEQKGSYAIERPDFLAQQMTRLEALAAQAMEDGNLSVALAAYRELHQLARLTS
jgi:hypothetical protein